MLCHIQSSVADVSGREKQIHHEWFIWKQTYATRIGQDVVILSVILKWL